jgi:transposase
VIRPKDPRITQRRIDEVFDALDEQTVIVPGTGTLDVVIPSLARSLGAVHVQRRALEAQIGQLLEAHPLSAVLTSIPGVAVRTAATLLVTVGDGTSCPTAAHLASYAGLAPTTKSSGTSIHGDHAPRGGNRQLKRAMFLSAFAALGVTAVAWCSPLPTSRPRKTSMSPVSITCRTGREEGVRQAAAQHRAQLRDLFAKLQAKHGTVLVVVDQPASIGTLPLAVARDMGCPVAYLPGLTMRRIADLCPGEAKTDARDAFIIADAARAMPHTLRALDGEDETVAELEMIVGFDDDLAGEATRGRGSGAAFNAWRHAKAGQHLRQWSRFGRRGESAAVAWLRLRSRSRLRAPPRCSLSLAPMPPCPLPITAPERRDFGVSETEGPLQAYM